MPFFRIRCATFDSNDDIRICHSPSMDDVDRFPRIWLNFEVWLSTPASPRLHWNIQGDQGGDQG
ncbi:uncharacterized protein EAF02_004412 [Botrytis sinoallii]|uniref:uncharacterized protein n=1 Tax=Botrytis sinoallii TaxID=1463999 RepID=UPI0019023E84|nr:uncharacterized protein EAF02_004412 [Botrytis sinoallii]KAF7885903.1 hypothetical protein EAF02_004412 [Botrytis sinoallii]